MHDHLRIAEEFPEFFVEPPHIPRDTREVKEHWSEMFHDIDKYDWDDPEWQAQNKGPFAFLPIPLTKGYFMIVSKRDYKRMTTYKGNKPKKWHAKVAYSDDGEIESLYGGRRGKGVDEPTTVLAHREVLRCLHARKHGDHANGFGLDNRLCNLFLCSTSLNLSNTARQRWANKGLLSGVEPRGFNKAGKPLYGGIRCKRRRLSKAQKAAGRKLGKVLTIRTKQRWLDPKYPHAWYLRQLEKLSGGRKNWAHAPTTTHKPVFPPRIDTEPTIRSVKLRAKNINGHAHDLERIPF